MKELDPAVFIAVFQEILGVYFWPLVALVVVGALAFLHVLVRDRGIASARFIWAELVGILGGFFAIWFAFFITNSNLADIGGPIDWVLLIAIWVIGAIGGTILAYVVMGLMARRAPAA